MKARLVVIRGGRRHEQPEVTVVLGGVRAWRQRPRPVPRGSIRAPLGEKAAAAVAAAADTATATAVAAAAAKPRIESRAKQYYLR